MKASGAQKIDVLPTTLPQLTDYLLPLVIRSERDYEKMVKWIDRLAILDCRTSGQQRFLDTLTILVDAYEREQVPINAKKGSVIKSLKFLLDENTLSGRDLGRILGQPQLGGKILRGERKLSKSHIRKLADHFKVSPALFF